MHANVARSPEAAGIEPSSRHYRNLVMAHDFRSLTLPVNDLHRFVECSAVLPRTDVIAYRARRVTSVADFRL